MMNTTDNPTTGAHRIEELGFTADEAEQLELALEALNWVPGDGDPRAALVDLVVIRQAIERDNGGDAAFFARLAEKIARMSERRIACLFSRSPTPPAH